MSKINVEITILDGQDLLDEYCDPDEQEELTDEERNYLLTEAFEVVEVKVNGNVIKRVCELQHGTVPYFPIKGYEGEDAYEHLLYLADELVN